MEIDNNNFFSQLKERKYLESLLLKAFLKCPNKSSTYIEILLSEENYKDAEILENYYMSTPQLTQIYIEEHE